MKLRIIPTNCLNGTVIVPGSKSHTVRGLFLATLAKGKSQLRNALESEDTVAAINVCKKLGAKIKKSYSNGLKIEIDSPGLPLRTNSSQIFSGNSGITTTFVLPVLGLRQNNEKKITLSCGQQMIKRPLKPIIEALDKLGMVIKSTNNNSCPLIINSCLLGGKTEIESLNSQYLSALLIALPCTLRNSEIKAVNIHERPYIDMTLSWLDEQNIRYKEIKSGKSSLLKIYGSQYYRPFKKSIPGDFSSASYLVAAGVLLKGRVTLKGLDIADSQGDKKLIMILQQMGAAVVINKQGVSISGGKALKSYTIDCSDIPDLIPTLAVIGTQVKGEMTLLNIEHARIKETDRIYSMSTELKKMGAKIKISKDKMMIYESRLKGAKLNGYKDHRTIMALAVAALIASGTSVISGAEAINKTFPDFPILMRKLGAKLKLIS